MRKNRKGSVQNHYRLLVLDDDEMITLALRAYFEGCGYQVDIESNPLQAIERIRQGDYDILLLDFLMTPICGDQVVEQIRQFNHDLFIILLTGHKDLAPPVKTIRELDIQGYYEKSDRFDQLELLVESCVKSIRQMKTIRSYRDGLDEILTYVPALMQKNHPQQLIPAIVQQLRSLSGQQDVFVLLNPLSVPEMTDKLSLVSTMLLSGSGEYQLDTAQFMKRCFPRFLPLIQQARNSREAQLSHCQLVIPLGDEQNRDLGILGVDFAQPPSATLVQLLSVYGHQVSSALAGSFLHTLLQNRNETLNQMNDQLKESHMQTISAVRLMVEAKDIYTRGHSDRVSYYATLLANRQFEDKDRIELVRLAGLFHDVGKIGVPDSILSKPGRLDDSEMQAIRRHAALGSEILSSIRFFSDIAGIVRSHHERWDGRGYPDGLAGTAIPLESRIIAVADAFDAMTSFRSYRQPLSLDQARQELLNSRGSQLDAQLVDDFIEILNDYDQIRSQLEWTFHEL